MARRSVLLIDLRPKLLDFCVVEMTQFGMPTMNPASPLPLSAAGQTAEAVREAVLNLTANLPMAERHRRFLELFSAAIGNASCALLRYQDGILVPVATRGLSSEMVGRTFKPGDHRRLDAFLRARFPVRFPDGGVRPDVYDTLIRKQLGGTAADHSCIGCGLYNEETLLGLLRADAVEPGAFRPVDDTLFRMFAAIAAVSLRYENFIETLENLARHRGLVNTELVNEVLQRAGPLLGESPATRTLNREIDIVARSHLTVLLTGETGVGKEVVARIIHSRSLRSEQPLVYVNCAALPESLAESELFGHVRGAFTGAGADRAGKFELAHGGTLFLDEIGELPLSIQAKLLRAVQFGEIQRLGSDRSHHTDVRFLAATNRRLEDEVQANRFRADLYHRLSMYPVHVPALRERGDDVAVLANHFLDQARVRLGLRRVDLAPATLRRLKAYDWPGNVRELEHVILRATLRAASLRGDSLALEPEDLDVPRPEVKGATDNNRSGKTQHGHSLVRAVDELQRERITAMLNDCNHNWSEAARRLGIDRGNLHRLAKRLGMK